MKKLFKIAVTTVCMFIILTVNAAVTTEETPVFVRSTVTNAVSPWFQVNTDNIGVAISVTAGSCKVEVALESVNYCKDNSATPFPWDGVNSIVSIGEKKYMTFNGLSCVRANCATGSALFLVRRH